MGADISSRGLERKKGIGSGDALKRVLVMDMAGWVVM